jgi:hypothetical protein
LDERREEWGAGVAWVALEDVFEGIEVETAADAGVVDSAGSGPGREALGGIEEGSGRSGGADALVAADVLLGKGSAGVDLDVAWPAVALDEGDLRQFGQAFGQLPEDGRRGVGEDGMGSTGEDGGGRDGDRVGVRVFDPVDAPMGRDQRPTPQLAVDCHPQSEELGAGNQPVLPGGEAGDWMVPAV